MKYVYITVYFLGIFLITIIVKKYHSNNKELLRKLIHIGMGPLIPLAITIGIGKIFALVFTGLICLLIIVNYIYKILPIIEDIDRQSFGTFFYSLSLFILISFFWNKDPNSLMVGVFIMTFGDGLAGLIGKNFKSPTWYILHQKKSLLGTLTMFLTSVLIVNYFGNQLEINLNFNYLLIPLIATFIEQFSIVGIDNLIVPIISSASFNLLITNIN